MKALYSLLVAALAAAGMASASAADAPFVNSQTVRQAQKVLNDRGFRTGGVDGRMGPQTQAALVNFQRAEKLQPTGKLDGATLKALNLEKSEHSASPNAAGHYPPATIRKAQETLNARGAAPVPEVREHRGDGTAQPAHARAPRHRGLGLEEAFLLRHEIVEAHALGGDADFSHDSSCLLGTPTIKRVAACIQLLPRSVHQMAEIFSIT